MTDAERIAELGTCYTSVVHDVLRARGLKDFTLPPRVRPLNPEGVLTGPAWTVDGELDESADAHATLLAWTGLLSKAPGGHIWTAQPNNQLVAQMGELSAETLHAKGVLGCVTDGALRDTNFILRLGWPCWGTHHTPRDVVGMWLPRATGEEIRIGEVVIAPGDWLHGDRDGMVRIPAGIVDEVIPEAVTAMTTESKVRRAILDGVDPQEAYLKWGKF
ncbi:RraA family protein [Histidinibacterium lentulum]|uniref:RraA family protein n=1 Tax=Histidinibacterium lentulum TaxID=2480588 RepID=A0A3N2QLP5_9RHOB|nr:RraA family protein [Histidinibacterium lentulum]ROT96096.1 RraA family protein [Histidinibacterium lentulum]